LQSSGLTQDRGQNKVYCKTPITSDYEHCSTKRGRGRGELVATITAVWECKPIIMFQRGRRQAGASDRSRGKSQISRDFKDKFAENKPI